MTGHAAVGVDDDLASGEPAVADRPSDHELAGRVDQEVVEQLRAVVEVGGQDRLDDALPQVGLDLALGVDPLGVLGRDQDLLDLDRLIVLVANRNLRLAVRAQVVERPLLADLREPQGEPVGERDRHRHQLGRLARRVAEHHALVARARDVVLVAPGAVGATLVGFVDALGDVGGLLVERDHHGAAVAIETVGRVVVPDLADGLAGDLLDVELGVRRDLARHHDEPGVDERLAGDATLRILGHDGVEHAVGDLIGHLVGVPLGHRLGGEQEVAVGGRLVHAEVWLLARVRLGGRRRTAAGHRSAGQLTRTGPPADARGSGARRRRARGSRSRAALPRAGNAPAGGSR